MFRSEEKAEETYNRINAKNDALVVEATDDFGQTILLRRESIHGVLLEDLSASKEAAIERMVHNAKTSAEAQMRAARDPALRHASQGPAVLSPGMMPRFSG
jgi:hypothetical protein